MGYYLNNTNATQLAPKAVNPLVAPYLKGGATAEQLEWLLERSGRLERWCEEIAAFISPRLSSLEAATLIEWIEGYNGDWTTLNNPANPLLNIPVLTPVSKAESLNWVLIVRQSLGLPEPTFGEKVAVRVNKIWFDENVRLLPLKGWEVFWVWVCALLISAGIFAVSGVLTFLFFAVALAVVFGAIGMVYLGFQNIVGFFRKS